MIVSPVLKYFMEREEKKYPSPSEKVKLGKTIGKYRLMLRRYNIGEIKFALADLLVGRGDLKDYKEAMALYDEILKLTPKGYLLAKALVGKAELYIGSKVKKELDQAIKLCDRAFKALKGDLGSFFGAKALVVKAELLHKRGSRGDHPRALTLFKRLLSKPAHWYFRARAMVGIAEISRYRGSKEISQGIDLCERALRVLKKRPHDYFAMKARVVESELRIKRNLKGDLEKAKILCQKVMAGPRVHKDLLARAKLNLAEISILKRAKGLHSQVLEMEGLDPYIIQKARAVERAWRAKR